jgi:multidrug efflux pump subunit AcrA (membrane-fusion protein)
MTNRYKALASLALAMAVATGSAQTTASKKAHHRHYKAHKPSVEAQIEQLENEMQSQRGQIDDLKQQLTERNAQLQQAQQAAQQAQQAAQQAQQAADQEQQTVTSNTTAVSNLQTSVSDLKSSNSTFVTKVKKQQEEIKKTVEHPDAIRYKGVTISPAGSFIEAATVWRNAATGGGINTPFTGVPLEHSGAAQQSEFKGSGRQSRIAIKATGKLGNVAMTAYYEMDWLGTGITSNNNQSNSYVVRQRQLWDRAAFT